MAMTKVALLAALLALSSAVGAALAPHATTSSQPPASRPNVVVVLADDQGWGDLSVHGNRNLNTPRIDSLARDGALFRHFYDITVDPGQQVDVAARHSAVAAELRQAAVGMHRELTAELGTDERPLPVGWAMVTELPAGDGVAAGAIERSNRFPNASYFTSWKDTTGSIMWDVEVAEPGEFEATIDYACPAADLGATLELGFRGTVIRARVDVAHDPPLLGAADDRVPRIESYFKGFKPMSLGTIRLKRGRGPLTLRAVDIPGSQAVEVSTLILTRK
jgi:hypothetical protein